MNFTIEKSPLIDVESKTLSVCIFSILESTIINVMSILIIVDMKLLLINN